MSYKTATTPASDDRIECVITCQNYGDFLAQTLPYNLPQLDRVVVVTSHDDALTKAVCKKYSVETVLTDVFQAHGEAFNKGAAINHGLAALRQRGWILHLDADIVLPLTFGNMMPKSALDEACIYGAERLEIGSWDQWQNFKHNQYHSEPQFSHHCLVTSPRDMPVGANLVHKQYGYCPIGYFQLWSAAYMKLHEIRYPESQGSAEQMDVQWALRWPRAQRLLLPTVRVFHLDSQPGPMGTNWKGRNSKPFTPDGKPLPVEPCAGYGYDKS